MNKFYIYNKRNLIQLFIFSFFIAIILTIFMLFYSPIRYHEKTIEKIEDSKLNNFLLVKNINFDIYKNKEYFLKLKKNSDIKNIFLEIDPKFKINKDTGLYSVPQVIDSNFLDHFKIELEKEVNISELPKLEKKSLLHTFIT